MSDFTPGPWKIYNNRKIVAETSHKTEQLVAVVSRQKVNPEQTNANVRLIAAAPNMYELLAGELFCGDAGVLSWGRENKIRAIFDYIHGDDVHA